MKRMLYTAAAILLFAAAAWLLLVWSVQRRLVFPRPAAPALDRAAAVEGLERTFLGAASEVEAWYLPPFRAQAPYPAIVFGHGNGELIDLWAAEFDAVRGWGVAVLLVEYPGYGRSGGSPTEESVTETFVAAYDWLATRADVDADAIVGWGRSLGGGAVCRLATRRPLAAMILESTFTGVAALARPLGVPGFLVRDPFDNLAAVREYERPLLILHGRHDRIVSFAQAERLHEAAADSTLHAMDCGHNDCPRPHETVHAFLERTVLGAGRRSATLSPS